MKISYFHVASDVPKEGKPDAAVVIDVLRATTTIAWALNNGADSIQVFADLEALKTSASLWPTSSRLLLGERGGQRISGFDLGNSPLGVSSEVVSNKRLFMSTTNGTRSLERVREVNNLMTMAFPNRKAVAEKLISLNPKEIWIVGSGWEGTYSLEDSLGAGSLASFLVENLPSIVQINNDELTAALALWNIWKNDIEGCLRIASHGQRLAGIGNHDDDFACCASLDNLSVIPKQTEMGVLRSN